MEPTRITTVVIAAGVALLGLVGVGIATHDEYLYAEPAAAPPEMAIEPEVVPMEEDPGPVEVEADPEDRQADLSVEEGNESVDATSDADDGTVSTTATGDEGSSDIAVDEGTTAVTANDEGGEVALASDVERHTASLAASDAEGGSLDATLHEDAVHLAATDGEDHLTLDVGPEAGTASAGVSGDGVSADAHATVETVEEDVSAHSDSSFSLDLLDVELFGIDLSVLFG